MRTGVTAMFWGVGEVAAEERAFKLGPEGQGDQDKCGAESPQSGWRLRALVVC